MSSDPMQWQPNDREQQILDEVAAEAYFSDVELKRLQDSRADLERAIAQQGQVALAAAASFGKVFNTILSLNDRDPNHWVGKFDVEREMFDVRPSHSVVLSPAPKEEGP